MPIMAKLNEAKASTNFTAAFLADYGDPRKQKQAERMIMCASGIGINADKRYVYGRGCKLPHCQVCSLRKSRVLMAQIARVGQIAAEDHPDCVWFYLVLTAPNCRLAVLHAAMDDFNNAFNRMTRTRGWSAIGALKAFEFPEEYWEHEAQAHPEIFVGAEPDLEIEDIIDTELAIKTHAARMRRLAAMYAPRVNLHANLLVLVPRDKADEFAANIGTMWSKANKADYLSVSCEPINQNGLVPAMGYSSKPTPVSYDAEYAIALADQLQGAHRIQAYGAVKMMFADVKEEWEVRKSPGGWRPAQGDVTWLEWNSSDAEYRSQEGEVATPPEWSEAATSSSEPSAINCTSSYADTQGEGHMIGMMGHGEQAETGEGDCQPAYLHGEGHTGDADGIESVGGSHGHDLSVNLRGSPGCIPGFLASTGPPFPGTTGMGAHCVHC
ncbi:hypothetical protein A6A04_19505 [Paramagnetospirillum marisnigri]|uniref:Uncharacterized protein n=2 Tax=Paramagnetospirillum marisnigri TaxID=1285242 RepID=A0A178MNA4_9PROT|nr:hypothetical protein A6A04_19505 [Paramagnetospirillum marisnigri]